MKFIHALGLVTATFGAALASTATAQDGEQEAPETREFYRVEVIVFTHAGSEPDGWPVSELAGHADAIDPSWQAFGQSQALERTESELDRNELESALSVVDTIASLESGETSLSEALLYPEPWLALDALSEPMAQARERMARSGAYRLVDVLAWHQPLESAADSREVRLHDDRLIAADWIEVDPLGRPHRNGRIARSASSLRPALHYRLDGSIRLRQRQFMHADVTLDWRAPETVGPTLWPVLAVAPGYATHRLQQSRTVRPDRFEYFDSDWLGVLLRITPYKPERSEGGGDDGTESS